MIITHLINSGNQLLTGNLSITGSLTAISADAESLMMGGYIVATQSFTTGVSGHLQSQISVLNNHTGDYYLNTNPSGFITGVDELSFLTLLHTGIEETGIMFPRSFSSSPRVFSDLLITGDTGYLVGIKRVSSTGYFAMFSDVIAETGIYLQTFATNL